MRQYSRTSRPSDTARPCRHVRLRSASVLFGLLLIVSCDRKPAPPASQPTTAAGQPSSERQPPQSGPPIEFPIERLGSFYQANADLEMDRNEQAAAIYVELIAHGIRDPAVLANLALARLHQQNLPEAEEWSRQAEAGAPENTGIRLIRSGILAATGRDSEARQILEGVLEAQPDHVPALWMMIALVGNQSDSDAKTRHRLHENLVKAVPRNLAALLSAAQAAADSERLDLARNYMDRVFAICSALTPTLTEQRDTLRQAVSKRDQAGVKRAISIVRNLMRQSDRYRADILALGPSATAAPAYIRHPVGVLTGKPPAAVRADIQFTADSSLQTLIGDPASGRRTCLALGTVTDDRSPAVYFYSEDGPGSLVVFQGEKPVNVTATFGLADAPPCRFALFADLNNDRRMDLILCTKSADRIFRLGDDGRFVDAAVESGLSDADGGSAGVAVYDFDNDGDLDLIQWNASQLRILRNDGEGTLSAIATPPGWPADLAGVRSVQPIDLDDDGDVDLFITLGDGPFGWRVISNERLATFKDVTPELTGIPKHLDAEPLITDIDNNGRMEIVDPAACNAYEIGDNFAVTTRRLRDIAELPGRRSVAAVAADFDCNGSIELLRMQADGGTDRNDVTTATGDRLTAVDLNRDGLPDLLSNGGRVFFNRTSGSGNWLAVGLHALIAGDSRFNSFGLYSTIEIRAGLHYQKQTVTGPITHFGLGPYNHADVMRVVWPNGSYQNLEHRPSDRLRLSANQVVIEEQTLKGSCPYLYAWNGSRFEFVTDVLWRSALGMSIMSGVYGHIGSADDYFKIDGNQLVELNGRFVLQFTEELWETAYFDYCRLFVVDHPIGTNFFVDEKCLTPPYPPFELFKVRQSQPILRAITGHGTDVTDLLSEPDGRFVDEFGPTRYQGIMEEHDLILDCGEFASDEQVRLFLRGWIRPTDASTNVAVSQNPTIPVRPPVFSVQDSQGNWQTLDITVGFPSGKNKTLVYDLTGKFPTNDHQLRISTNFAIYWDHAFLTRGPQDVELRVTELPISSGHLHDRGFSIEYPRVPGGPMIPDYDALDHDRIWRDLIGEYTPFGDVTGLLKAIDDQYVVVGAGDEITIQFDAGSTPPLPTGWTRSFVIHTDGWLKDGDLNSATGKTVEPLPFRSMTEFPPRSIKGAAGDTHGSNGATTPQARRWRDQSVFRNRIRMLDCERPDPNAPAGAALENP
ncbi:MAG: VCBS repeat-containing protein [Phycisphaerae bacterium]|nr:VCBS repeat-containing protein [Phycisphaerae bacterium]